MKRLIAVCEFVYGFLLVVLAGWHLAQATDGEMTAWIVFSSSRAGNPDIYRMRMDGSQAQNLTHNPSLDFPAQVTPDGRV